MLKITKEAQLLATLLEWQKDMSRSKVKQILQNRRILVNGKPTTQFDYMLQPGDKLEIASASAVNRGLSNKYLEIVYEDRFLVVIDKKEGILSMGTSHHAFCLKTVLDRYFDKTHQRCRAHVVHRLDRDTSGLMIFAKSRDVQQLFEADWKGLVYDRRYVAVAEGVMNQDNGTISNWLKDNKQCFTFSSQVDNGGKWAVTHFQVLERGNENTLVELKLDTGRKNQIRVHLSDLGHPVLGDPKYNIAPEDRETEANQGVQNAPRLCLHAYKLHFTHPVTQEPMCFDTPIPKLFKTLL